MSIIACGLNHKTAPLNLRERFSIVPENLPASLQALSRDGEWQEATILSTCNRTEFYVATKDSSALLNWVCGYYQCQQDEIGKYFYRHEHAAAVRHILRVATGLDSMVIGEPQILGQMKHAFSQAEQAGLIGPCLQRLFQYIFSTSKQVRSSTGIGNNPVSIAYAAVRLAKQIFDNLSQCAIMVVGAGETIELVLRYLHQNGSNKITVVNRTVARAQELAEKFSGKAVTFADMARELEQVDIVVTATSSAIPVIGKGTLERVFKLRKHKPLFMVDLAVPRDIEPEASELPDVYLYCVDDLKAVIERNLGQRLTLAEEAERLVDLQVEHYMKWIQSLDVVDTIRKFRRKFESLRDQEIHRAMQLLQQGTSPQQVCCHLARNLTNKLLHSPTIQLRKAGYEQDLELLALTQQLFDLEKG